MVAKNFLWILSLNAIFLIGKVTEIDSSGTAFSVTGVEADLDALNTTALQLIWNSKQKPTNVSIENYEIKIGDETLVTIHSDNVTDSYSYTITGGEPGANYTVTLIVNYTLEIQDTTLAQATTVAQVTTVTEDTTVTVPDTTTTSALTTDSTTASMRALAIELRQLDNQQESIHLFNNTYPATPTTVNLTWRDTQSLTFSWYQEGEADSCNLWADDATMATSACSIALNKVANGTISGLPVAGRQYPVHIVSISGGLNSETYNISDRTLPPNPSVPQCMSPTNTSLTFMIPTPDHPGDYELDEYEVIIKSLIDPFPYNTTILVSASVSSETPVTIHGLEAGVTYNIILTTRAANVSSAGSSSNNCVTELNVPLINNVINTTETTVGAAWQTPLGYYEGFNLSCTGQNSTKNASAVHNLISSNTSEQLHAECQNVTAGALYKVNVASLLYDPSETSNASESVFNVTVPYAPKKVLPSHATMNLIQIQVEYGYTVEESQCTQFEVTDLGEPEIVVTVPAIDPVIAIFSELTADKSYNFSTYAVSNYTQASSYLWRRSSNSTPTSAWTLALSVTNIIELERGPRSLLIQFDQMDPHDHVWQYVIHVNTTSGRISTINLTCQDVPKETLTMFNCETNSDVTTNHSTTCRTKTPCTATTELPESTQVTKVTSVTSFKETTTGMSEEVTGTTVTGPTWDAKLSNSTAQSICFNISGLEPYINYSISVQAVNPGGCSVMETVALRTAEWIPGCVNITHFNESYDSIEVHWNPPDKPNGIIIRYVINYTRHDGLSSMMTTTNETFCILQPLEPYVEYNITVAAETTVGVGQVSGCPLSTKSAKTKIGKPYKPILAVYAISATSINITWTLDKDVKTGPETYYNLTITDVVNATWTTKEEHVEGFYNRSIVVDGLDEYWLYNVSIVAYTIDESVGELATLGDTVTNRTLESTPGPVQFFNVTSLISINKCYLARIVWDPPSERDLNGIILSYHLRWSKTGDSNFASQNFTDDLRTADVSVEPNGQAYTFAIMATTSIGQGTPFDNDLDSTGFCGPAPLDVEVVFGESSEYTPTQTSFTVLYDLAVFKQNDNGPVIASALLVAEHSETLNETTEQFGGMEFFNGSKTWSDAVKISPIPEYRPTSDSWLTDGSGLLSSRQRRELLGKYVVGKNGSCSGTESSYCNGPLPSNRIFRVRGVICTQMDQCYKTALPDIRFKTEIPDTAGTPEDLAWIAGVVIGLLALIALIVFLVYFFVYRKRRYGSESSDSDKEMDRHFPLTPEEKVKPIRTVDFPARVLEMHRNSDLEFNDEYQSIQNQSARRPWTAAEKPKNRVKNRFVNILPFDHSRVVLRTSDNDDEESESDYINANYIPNSAGIREFIACQGPLESTKDDFWQMVWEHNSRVIVMLTNVKEKGREKCAQYWPERAHEPSRYGNMDVSLISESYMDYYVIRRLEVSAGTQTREIRQFHFISWPDFGVPAEPEKVLAFVREVRNYAGNSVDPPIVAHCSAGVGRTGTFIVLDRLLRELPRAETIDIFRMVVQLRENRCLMVQTEAQYVFIHDCMKLEIERTLLGHNNQSYNAHEDSSFTDDPIYQNSGEIIDNNNISLQTFKYD